METFLKNVWRSQIATLAGGGGRGCHSVTEFMSGLLHKNLFLGEPYTSFEKTFMMFDDDVWITIVITFTLGLVIIQVVNFCCDKVKNIVFGDGVRTPTMNFFAAIFGVGQTRLPRRSFGRILLMLFIILCLILRTCHQSMLYKLLQSDLRKPELQTIDEAIGRGFTFYMTKGDMKRQENAEYMSR
jgi:hypothetical protein